MEIKTIWWNWWDNKQDWLINNLDKATLRLKHWMLKWLFMRWLTWSSVFQSMWMSLFLDPTCSSISSAMKIGMRLRKSNWKSLPDSVTNRSWRSWPKTWKLLKTKMWRVQRLKEKIQRMIYGNRYVSQEVFSASTNSYSSTRDTTSIKELRPLLLVTKI